MSQVAQSYWDTKTPSHDIGQGRRARLARIAHALGVLPAIQRVRDARCGGLRILAYHRILESAEPSGFAFDPGLISASASAFDVQMGLLKRHYQPTSLAQVLAMVEEGRPLPARSVVVTFDDGYEDNHRIALPILQKHGVPATFFVSTAHIDTGKPYAYDWLFHMICTAQVAECSIPELRIDEPMPGSIMERRRIATLALYRLKLLDAQQQEQLVDRICVMWDIPYRDHDAVCRPMTWNQVRDLHRAGMEIGSHGANHRMLAKLPEALLLRELSDSREILQEQVGGDINAISYPVGGFDAYDSHVIHTAIECGYRIGCSYVVGVDRPASDNLMSLRRIPIERDMDMIWFEAILAAPEVFAYQSNHRVG